MFDHEKMSEKDQIRYAEAMQASIDAAKTKETQDLAFIPNCGAPLNPEAVKAGKTWCSNQRKWVTHQELGATVSKPPKGWRDLFGRDKRYSYRSGLKVVSIVYDWKLYGNADNFFSAPDDEGDN